MSYLHLSMFFVCLCCIFVNIFSMANRYTGRMFEINRRKLVEYEISCNEMRRQMRAAYLHAPWVIILIATSVYAVILNGVPGVLCNLTAIGGLFTLHCYHWEVKLNQLEFIIHNRAYRCPRCDGLLLQMGEVDSEETYYRCVRPFCRYHKRAVKWNSYGIACISEELRQQGEMVAPAIKSITQYTRFYSTTQPRIIRLWPFHTWYLWVMPLLVNGYQSDYSIRFVHKDSLPQKD